MLALAGGRAMQMGSRMVFKLCRYSNLGFRALHFIRNLTMRWLLISAKMAGSPDGATASACSSGTTAEYRTKGHHQLFRLGHTTPSDRTISFSCRPTGFLCQRWTTQEPPTKTQNNPQRLTLIWSCFRSPVTMLLSIQNIASTRCLEVMV